MHSHIDHLFALITALKELKVPKLFIHFLGDGRDTSPTSGGYSYYSRFILYRLMVFVLCSSVVYRVAVCKANAKSTDLNLGDYQVKKIFFF